MQTKLTLRIEQELIDNAKKHSAQTGRSISQLIASFLALIDQNNTTPTTPSARITKLRGSLKNPNFDEQTYKDYLAEKHL